MARAMLPKLIESHPSAIDHPEGFRARAKYVCKKATTVQMINLTGDWEAAAQQMAFTAGLNPRTRMACCHLAFTWSETEPHSDAQLIEAMQMVLQELGAGEHQVIFGIHRDRPNPHGHSVANLVHPVTGKTLSMSHSFARLEHACRVVENRMGWPADRGRFDVEMKDDQVTLCPKPRAHWEQKVEKRELGLRPENRTAREQRRHAVGGYLRDDLDLHEVEQLTSAMDSAGSWQGVHAALSSIGFLYQRYRSGARIVETRTQRQMPAGAFGTRFGLHRMCMRLGSFVAAALPVSLIKPATSADKWRKLRRLKRQHARQRNSIREKLGGVRSPGAQALRAFVKEVQEEETRTLKDTLGLPQPRPQPDRIQSVPERYRHALELRASPLPGPDDHTARRQDWALSSLDAIDALPEVVVDLLYRYPDTMRADGARGLLFAGYGPDGSILSFERLSLDATFPVLMPAHSAHGICVIGPHPTDTCLLVRAHLDAIIEMLQVGGPMPMVIVVGNELEKDRAAQIAWLARGRKVAIADAGFDEVPATLDKLHRMFPNAKIWGNARDMEPDPADTFDDEVTDTPPVDDIPSP